MKKPLRIAVIGNGRWGKNIIKTLNTLPECVVSYIATHDYTYLLRKDDIDAVVIATPPNTHTKIALQFLAKKIPLFIEKPMTVTLKDARTLREMSKKMGTSIFVGHIDLYNPAYIALQKAKNKVGVIHTVMSEGASMGPFRNDVSVLFDWAPHNCAMLLDTIGEMPIAVQAFGASILKPKSNHYDTVSIKLTFPSGRVGFIFNSRLSPKKKRNLSIVGTKGTLVYNDVETEKAVVSLHPITIKRSEAPSQPPIALPYDNSSPLTEELSAFLKSVRTKKSPKTDARNGANVVSILEAAEKSIRKGGTRVRI